MKRFFLALAVLALAVLACSFPRPTAAPAAPVTAPPVIQPQENLSPTVPPVRPPVSSAFLPGGFVVTDGKSNLVFYNADGARVGTLALDKSSYFTQSTIHVAGRTSSGLPPVVYTFFDGSSAGIAENAGGVKNLLAYESDVFVLTGAPGSPYFAYTTASYASDGLLTRMYFGTARNIASSAPVLEVLDRDGYALKPLAFRFENGAPTGIWYTLCAYGIGGDVVFEPCNRLHLLNLKTGSSTQTLGDGFSPFSISPDGAWVGYAASGEGQPIQFMNLNTGEWNSIPAWPRNDRGSGKAVFSPDGSLIAWMEASGSVMEGTLQANIRLAKVSGAEISQNLNQDFQTAAGFPVLFAAPVGWLDNDSVLVEVHEFDWNKSAILRLDADGNITYLAPGNFIALTYP